MLRIVRQSNLPLRVSFSTPKPLFTLRKPVQTPCPEPCYCGETGLCFKKNVVYRVTCNLCSDAYIGETGGTLWTRIMQHITTQSSGVNNHFRSVHGKQPEIQHIHVKVLSSGFETAEHRRYMEALLISEQKPAINVQLGS